MTNETDCPFCDSGIIEKQKVAESEYCFALQNIRPANFGQCLVIPKRHVRVFRELEEKELHDLIGLAQNISRILNGRLETAGFNYGFNEQEYAGQMVGHFHFHIMPRVEGDKDRLPEYHLFHGDPQAKRDLPPDELAAEAAKLRALLAA